MLPERLPKRLHTLRSPFSLSGVGLHSGVVTQVRVLPSEDRPERYFVRMDLPDQPIIPANLSLVREAMLSTELGEGQATVRTVEHLLAALVGCGVDAARIEVDGPEMPLLDGSALPWVEAIAQAGLQPLTATERSTSQITEAVWITEGDMFVAALPCPELRFSYGVDYPYAPIGRQWVSWQSQQESFTEAIAPARTFGFADQIEALRQTGLIKGGSLENALVCDRDVWLNPPLRFPDEPVRHKLLDFLGDLSLLGQIPQGHYLAYKASHRLHTQLAKAITLIAA